MLVRTFSIILKNIIFVWCSPFPFGTDFFPSCQLAFYPLSTDCRILFKNCTLCCSLSFSFLFTPCTFSNFRRFSLPVPFLFVFYHIFPIFLLIFLSEFCPHPSYRVSMQAAFFKCLLYLCTQSCPQYFWVSAVDETGQMALHIYWTTAPYFHVVYYSVSPFPPLLHSVFVLT